MKKFILLLLILFLVGCSKGSTLEEENIVEEGAFEKIFIDIDLENEQTDEYYVFLVKPGTLGKDGKATRITDFYGPVEVEDFKAELDLIFNDKVTYLLDELDEKKLQLVITTKEDFLIRNPLNEETFVYFEKKDEISGYFSTKEKFDVSIIDKYPDGVLSLPWPEADFVVKLKFKDGITPRHSYGVRIREFSDRTPSGLGLLIKGSPLSNESNYYNAVFYSEYLKGFAGVLEIEGQQPKTVDYEGNPLTLRFDEFGKHIGDDVIEITITEGE